MADLSCQYVLTTPTPTITFNAGDLGDGTDKYWLQDVQGLDGLEVRAPTDPVPMGYGTLIHEFWLAGRKPYFDGVIIIESVSPWGPECQEALNLMEENLQIALAYIISPSSGTLSWTPAGLAARTLPVFFPGPLTIRPIENFALRQFTFQLISPDYNWT